MERVCKELLQTWSQDMLKLQIKDTGNSRLDGAIICPACGMIHGRCFEAMYPFLYMAESSQDEVWVRAAEQLFQWAERVVSQPDGSFVNDSDGDWKGTTVFNVIQLADCLLYHRGVLSEQTELTWKIRLKKAAEFLYTFDAIINNNINYPISAALALYECGMVLEDERFMKKAETMASIAEKMLTEHDLLFGEGTPYFQKSSRDCNCVDIGYNVEETLPALALYGKLSGNASAFEVAEKALLAQLDFMAADGAWDNSFGTRNYKWTYWGSRTSDGCALGYLLFADKYPEFALAAEKNLNLLKQCTYDGLLTGGPHYQAAGQAACVHHTFTHAKVLAGVLDQNLCVDVSSETLLPRQQKEGIRYYPEIETWLVKFSSMVATVTAYDWEYQLGGHVSGGTLSFLHHSQAGTLLCASMGQYVRRERNNMQVPVGVRHECLALRIEFQIGEILYSSIYEDCVQVLAEETRITARGCLKDIHHKGPTDRELPYMISYEWGNNSLHVNAEFDEGILICPLISRNDEAVEVQENHKQIRIQKGQSCVCLNALEEVKLPYGTERIFNLVPGFQALRVDMGQGPLAFSIDLDESI